MKTLLLAMLVLACATAPSPKVPDESHRVPVNQVVPAEASPDGGREDTSRKERRAGEVEWR